MIMDGYETGCTRHQTEAIYPYDGQLKLSGSIVTIGTFDGVHKGHQALMHRVVTEARGLGVASIVYTFDPPPKSAFAAARQLTSVDEKLRRLSHFGLDYVLVANFTKDYASRPAESFIEELGHLNPAEVWVGEDFRFGRGRVGDIHMLSRYFNLRVMQEVVCPEGGRISSTRLRELVEQGRDAEAADLHGWPHNSR